MVNDGEREYVIDGITFISISEQYLVNKKGYTFWKDPFTDHIVPEYDVERVFPSNYDHVYTENVVVERWEDNVLVKEDQTVCTARGLSLIINGCMELYVIGTGCDAYLCNNEGKTIKKFF